MMSPRGFTLIELLVVVALLALLATIAVPSFRELAQSNRITADINRLNASLQAARAAAIRSGQDSVVCPSPDGLDCLPDTPNLPWEQGWMSFIDPDGDGDCGATAGSATCADGGRVLQVTGPLEDGTLRANGNPNELVRYSPDGTAGRSWGTFTRCSADGQTRAGFTIILTGRLARSTPASITCP